MGIWAGIMTISFVIKLLSPILPLLRFNRKRLEQSGVVAEALVLKMEKTGLLTNNKHQVKLQMQVQPDKGRNFVAEINEILCGADLSAVRAGSIVRVKYNPKNFKEIILL